MMNHFERLGLPRRFSISLTDLEREYISRSRETHPDFHAVTGSQSEEASALVNEAYTTLKDSFRRAEYLLKLQGGADGNQDKTLPPAFLMEAMEWREKIEEAQASNSTTALEAIDAELVSILAQTEAQVGELLDVEPLDTKACRGLLNQWKTLLSLRRTLD
ncbi:MAG: Fe-S protein assembly co-chaperone HscB [Fimbriiglobus sp.]